VIVWAIVAIVVVVILVGGALWARARRTQQLRDRFGPEYGRTVEELGDHHAAEENLRERVKRREQLAITPLSAEERRVFSTRWDETQARFVDEPATAVGDADRLIADAMRARGYPVETFEQQAADVSVDHPEVVSEYRAGHAIADANGRQQASTEDLRQAMVHYRALFDRLVNETDEQPEEEHERAEALEHE
jgi:FtsZ-interacting cell division protein ZipA